MEVTTENETGTCSQQGQNKGQQTTSNQPLVELALDKASAGAGSSSQRYLYKLTSRVRIPRDMSAGKPVMPERIKASNPKRPLFKVERRKMYPISIKH